MSELAERLRLTADADLRALARDLLVGITVDERDLRPWADLMDEAADRIAGLESEVSGWKRIATDPIAVHVSMLAGTIAKPSVEAIIHVYGHKALCAALRETDGEPPPQLTDSQPKGSETP